MLLVVLNPRYYWILRSNRLVDSLLQISFLKVSPRRQVDETQIALGIIPDFDDFADGIKEYVEDIDAND